MDWPALRRFADAAIGPDGRTAPFGSSRPPTRSGRRPSADFTCVMTASFSRTSLIELEQREWARQAAIEELRR